MTIYNLTPGSDLLIGGSGADRFEGTAGGFDILAGGAGNDVFAIEAGSSGTIDGGGGSDVLLTAGTLPDMIITGVETWDVEGGYVHATIAGINNFSTVTTAPASGPVIWFDLSGEGGTLNLGALLGDGHAARVMAENLTSGARITGTAGDDWMTGGIGGDTISGGSGHDWIDGGAGNDAIDGGAGNDHIHGSDGNDTLKGGAGDDWLVGEAGNDKLSGGAGTDHLRGGDGADIYGFNRGDGFDDIYDDGIGTAADRLVFGAGIRGTDIGVGIAGFGNDLQLSIKGTADAALLLSAATNDAFAIEFVEFADGMTWSHAQLLLMARAGSNNGVFLGTDLDDVVNLGAGADSGSGGAGNDRILGGSGDDALGGDDGDDYLDGGTGGDELRGHAGNDVYIVDNARDQVFEFKNDGDDLVYSSVSFDLGSQYIETLVLTGTGAIWGTGNAQANTIAGNDAANRLEGKGGEDILTGGGGADLFAFGSPTVGTDTITDFTTGVDRIQVSARYFGGGLVAGGPPALIQADSLAGGAASGGHFIFDNAGADAGNLYWDANGGSTGDAVLIAVLSGVTLISGSDFLIV